MQLSQGIINKPEITKYLDKVSSSANTFDEFLYTHRTLKGISREDFIDRVIKKAGIERTGREGFWESEKYFTHSSATLSAMSDVLKLTEKETNRLFELARYLKEKAMADNFQELLIAHILPFDSKKDFWEKVYSNLEKPPVTTYSVDTKAGIESILKNNKLICAIADALELEFLGYERDRLFELANEARFDIGKKTPLYDEFPRTKENLPTVSFVEKEEARRESQKNSSKQL